jgi:hypothetical protein
MRDIAIAGLSSANAGLHALTTLRSNTVALLSPNGRLSAAIRFRLPGDRGLSGNATLSANTSSAVPHTIARMSDASGALSGNASVSDESRARLWPSFAVGPLSYVVRGGLSAGSDGGMSGDASVSTTNATTRVSDTAGILSGDAIARMSDASGILPGDPGMSADAVSSMPIANLSGDAGVSPDTSRAVSHTITRMSYRTDGMLSADSDRSVSHTITRMSYGTDGMLSGNSDSAVSDTIARMSDASGILSGDGVMSADTSLAVPHTVARLSDASGVLSGDGVMSISAGRVSDKAGLSHVIAAVLSGGDTGRSLWWWAR